MAEDYGSPVGLTLRELVLEIRNDVKSLNEKVDKIDRTGSIGTREELSDHETRIRHTERWVYAIPASLFIAIASIVAPLMH